MEKLNFAIRFFVILLSLPVVMFAELTRKDSVNKPKQVIETTAQKASDNTEFVCQFYLMQAVYN
jgi:hypothetical protein